MLYDVDVSRRKSDDWNLHSIEQFTFK